jgi:hypothetical protein
VRAYESELGNRLNRTPLSPPGRYAPAPSRKDAEQIVNGEPIDPDQLIRVSSTSKRLLGIIASRAVHREIRSSLMRREPRPPGYIHYESGSRPKYASNSKGCLGRPNFRNRSQRGSGTSPKPPSVITRVSGVEKNIALGLELLLVRSAIKHNGTFGRQVRGQCGLLVRENLEVVNITDRDIRVDVNPRRSFVPLQLALSPTCGLARGKLFTSCQ